MNEVKIKKALALFYKQFYITFDLNTRLRNKINYLNPQIQNELIIVIGKN